MSIKDLVPLSRFMPSTPGCFKCNLIVPDQCLAEPFLHKIAMGSAILVPSAILISLSLACVMLRFPHGCIAWMVF